MRARRALFCVLVSLSVCSLQGQMVWSQDTDPFGANPSPRRAIDDPFGSGGSSNDPFADTTQTKKNQNSQVRRVKQKQMGEAVKAKPPFKQQGADEIHVRASSVNLSESEARITAALTDETTQTFIDTPLNEAVFTIGECHNIPMVVDRRALEEIGISDDAPVTIDLKNVTLRSFLRLMLRELDLTYMIDDEVLQITTVEAAEQNLVTRMYRLPSKPAIKSSELLNAMKQSVVPDTWITSGGPSVATAIDHVLIVSTTSDVHYQVNAFLSTLYETYGSQ